MAQHNEQKRMPQNGKEGLLCLSVDYGRLRGMQRNLLRPQNQGLAPGSTGEKRENLQAEFLALLAKSRQALERRRNK